METVIAGLRGLPANWDTYDSPPIPQAVLTAVADIMGAADDEGLPSPNIVPFEGSGVQVEWYEPTHGLEFVIHANGELEYVLIERPDNIIEEAETPQVDPDLVRQHMRRFMELVGAGR